MRRVAVTGLGMVAPTGNTVAAAWQAAVAGQSGVARISAFDPTNLSVHIAAEVKGFDPLVAMEHKDARHSSRFVQFAAAASKEAMLDSGLDTSGDTERWGCSIGVGIGGLECIETNTIVLKEQGPRRISPFFLPFTIPNMAAGYVSIQHRLRGPNMCTATACASGTHAIGEAFLYIASGMADVMLAGGVESAISPLGIACFASMKALSTNNSDPAGASRPFDKDRDGFVMGEGGGLLVLEEWESAQRRGAKIYAEMVGYGLCGDASHITSPAPGGEGAARCMRLALQSARVDSSEVDHINAHGTSTKLNDFYESQAIASVFGSRAGEISISSTKGVTGHCLGAAGGLEAVYSVLAVHHALIPPTANWRTRDADCPLDYTPTARERKVRYALSNSFGFGGPNGTLVFKRA